MANLTKALTATTQTVAYLPAANCFYVRDRPGYQPLASGQLVTERLPS